MTMALTGAQVAASAAALTALAQQPMPAQGAIAVRNATRAVQAILQDVHELAQKASEDAQQDGRSADDAANAVYADALADIFPVNVRPIPLGLLGSAYVTPAQMEALGWLIVEIAAVS